MRYVAGTIAFLLMALGACDFAPQATILDIGSVVTTDKTLGDHLVSIGSGKDCSSVRTEKGQTYCKEDELHLAPAVYCYPSLGDITCFGQPDPYDTGKLPVGADEHNFVRTAPNPARR
jgi:hypothetical protein